jgi:plastocyanin
MIVRRMASAAALAVGSCFVLCLGGCGGSEGVNSGASSPTTVIVKREKTGAASAAPEKATTEPGAAQPAAAGGFGTLKGRVVFQGTAPVLQPLIQKGQNVKDAVCAKETIPDQKLVVDGTGGVANVVVFLAKAPPGAVIPPPPAEPAEFTNKQCHFVPHVLLMRVGQTVKILNDDAPLQHNTHTHPQRSTPFNTTIPKEGKEFKYSKPEAEPCEVTCEIHSWMRGYQFPLDHPFVAASGPNGEFEIKNIPAGQHSFRVWAEGAIGHYLSRNLSVTIKPGETTNVEIKYDATSFAG